MSEMIERVARAIAADNVRGNSNWQDWLVEARAAIEAMREPTEKMWDAGAADLYGVSREKAIEYAKEDKFESDGRKADEIWRAMIDAALSDQPPEPDI